MEALYLQWWRFLLWLCSFSPFVFQYSIWILLPISFVFQIFFYVHVYIRFCSYLYVQSKFEASTCTGSVLNNKNTSVCVCGTGLKHQNSAEGARFLLPVWDGGNELFSSPPRSSCITLLLSSFSFWFVVWEMHLVTLNANDSSFPL